MTVAVAAAAWHREVEEVFPADVQHTRRVPFAAREDGGLQGLEGSG
eukprot:CAMPEP_0181210988 /NCGR_PEP_ID=MMETSP1096-20121128/23540_1 /TAXON_ID=156174 ORGANISM="Chrysochromulina ericina, Strain CCMP281" /NCGR_SAMPLE_ID=MMETSP1096 /ASSEMBLY_ACC=CAM_ASM_000453 /LENGTH=45 /DNA_ID= /DNA_START= /DNA_END= /DNA_ORIENTATION=